MRLSGTQARSISSSRGLGNQLWDLAGNRPSLDLPFAESKSLVDATTGTNLIDFTRASSGTYVGSDGLIKTATTNLLTYSEEADNPAWNIIGSSILVDPDVTTAPDGAQTADKVKEATTTGSHNIEFAGFAFQSGTTYTVSFYAKAVERSRFRVTWPTLFTNRLAFVDVSPGGYGVISDGGTVASVLPVGGDWFRVVSTTTCTTTTTGARVGITLVDTGTNVNYTGDGTSGLYLWGAQLEQSSTVGEYVKTTSTINSAPRFHHNPTTGESLGLLVEESRTNLIPYSQQIGLAGFWGINNSSNGVLTLDNATAPDGTFTATTVVASGNFYGPNEFIGNLSASTDYTFSAWLKNNSATEPVRPNIFGYYAQFLNGELTINNANITSSSIEEFSDGWYRISLTANSGAGGVLAVAIYGNDGADFECWGAQLEQASTPSTYIPTTTTAVTRSADVASISDGPSGSNFSSWYRQDEGTVFWSGARVSTSGYPARFRLWDGTNANTIHSYWDAAVNSSTFSVASSGVSQVAIYGGQGELSAEIASAFGIKENDVSVYYDGVLKASDASATIPAVNQAQLGNGLTGHISRLTYWPQRLPNETLKTITQ